MPKFIELKISKTERTLINLTQVTNIQKCPEDKKNSVIFFSNNNQIRVQESYNQLCKTLDDLTII